MELHWDYDYYQSQTNNEQMVKEMIAIRNEEDKDDIIDDVSVYQGQDFRLDWTNYRHQTKREILDKPQDNYKQILLQL